MSQVSGRPVDWLQLYFEEDLGSGDVTSNSIFRDESGSATLVARQPCFVAGLHVAADVFARLDVEAQLLVNDGTWVEANQPLLQVSGPVAGILAGERLALNILGRMSGIATKTRTLVETLARECSTCTVAATRKTTPGFRTYEKMAVTLAGGDPHRAGLFDVAMIKDNHREALGSISEAVRRIQLAQPGVDIIAEVESLEDALAAAAAGAQWLLIDNQGPAVGKAWAEAVRQAHPLVNIEASGGIKPGDIVSYGWADRVSLGALTTEVTCIDLSLEWDT